MPIDKQGTFLKPGDLVVIDLSELRWVKTKDQSGWEIQFFRSYELVTEAIVQHVLTKEIAFFPVWTITKESRNE